MQFFLDIHPVIVILVLHTVFLLIVDHYNTLLRKKYKDLIRVFI